jgi:hypothetical protein
MRSLRYIMAVATLSVVSLWGGGSAQARSSPQDDVSASAEECTIRVDGKAIVALCDGYYGDGDTAFRYQGRIHHFVIRAYDRSVWHIWETSPGSGTYSPWTGLGGTALSAVWYRIYGQSLKIAVTGTDHSTWCRQYNTGNRPGAWGPWYSGTCFP